jgi:sterol desaturase/sphingolipid hydroxylase (fatty acid hydroxylase superfamily)
MSSLEDYQKVVWMMTSAFTVVYWTNGLLLFALDHFCAKRLDRYRIQKEVKSHSRPSTGKLIRNLLINTCMVPLIALAIGLSVNFKPSDFEIPGPFELFLSAVAGVIVNEIFFFYGHWLFHANKFL